VSHPGPTDSHERAFWPVLFDLDGTITDSAPGILACLRYSLHSVGHPGLPQAILTKFLGPPLVDAFTEHAGMSAQEAQEALGAYRERFASVGMFENSVYPGVGEVIAGLAASGVVLALATSKPELFANRILAHFGLGGHFSVVVGAELDGRRNGKADVVAEALHRLSELGQLPAEARPVLVGDREHDVAGARANGLACIGVGWGYAAPGELEQAGAVTVVADARELGQVLRSGLPVTGR
jgi:phosphoglycolate phosphatase